MRSAFSLRPLVGFRAGGFGVGELDHRHAVGQLEALFERIRQPRADIGFHHQPVDHHVDVVGEFLVERLDLLDFVEGAVDLDALVALAQEVGELLAVFALAAAHHRRQHIDARALRQCQHAVDHLRHGLAFNGQSSRRRIGHADARPQQAHVVVDLGDGADGGARILRGGLLLDGNGRRQPVDLVDVRLLHHFQELAGVCGQRFHIAALALGIDRVESERGFAGSGQTREHDQLVARNGDVDIFEIVLAGAADGDHAGIAAGVFAGKIGHRRCGRPWLTGLQPAGAGFRRLRERGDRSERSENGGLAPVRCRHSCIAAGEKCGAGARRARRYRRRRLDLGCFLIFILIY